MGIPKLMLVNRPGPDNDCVSLEDGLEIRYLQGAENVQMPRLVYSERPD
jgi:hypothetical protein